MIETLIEATKKYHTMVEAFEALPPCECEHEGGKVFAATLRDFDAIYRKLLKSAGIAGDLPPIPAEKPQGKGIEINRHMAAFASHFTRTQKDPSCQ